MARGGNVGGTSSRLDSVSGMALFVFLDLTLTFIWDAPVTLASAYMGKAPYSGSLEASGPPLSWPHLMVGLAPPECQTYGVPGVPSPSSVPRPESHTDDYEAQCVKVPSTGVRGRGQRQGQAKAVSLTLSSPYLREDREEAGFVTVRKYFDPQRVKMVWC